MILIDRDAVLKTIPNEEIVARMAVMSAPTVDAVPVRHGKWIEEGRGLVCSCCGKAYTLAETNYCLYCGAKMEVDRDLCLLEDWEKEQEKQNERKQVQIIR